MTPIARIPISPTDACTTTSTISGGIVIITSARTRMTSSVRPPMKPAEKPRKMPMAIPISEAMTPINKVFGAPTMSRASMSRPLLCVPSGCAGTPASPRMFSNPISPNSRIAAMMPKPVSSLGFIQGESNRRSRLARRRAAFASAALAASAGGFASAITGLPRGECADR